MNLQGLKPLDEGERRAASINLSIFFCSILIDLYFLILLLFLIKRAVLQFNQMILRFFLDWDATGWPTPGILQGNLVWLGRFEDCQRLNDGLYCLAQLEARVSASSPLKHSNSVNINLSVHHLFFYLSFPHLTDQPHFCLIAVNEIAHADNSNLSAHAP